MATTLNILVIPTYSKDTLGMLDASVYDGDPTSGSIEITPPDYDAVTLSFNWGEYNVFTSEDLEITDAGDDTVPLPDGVYSYTYSITPEDADAITGSFMRIEQLQEKFDAAFMRLDMMECDKAIKKQSKVELSTIYFFMQAALSAANNCAVYEANQLYTTANRMLDTFIIKNCGCSGTNYLINFV